ncbi:MAG: hypothetical protein FWH02_07455 [Oscillospiraceae bacterium]|nr:hypothetical protein [Oscillospiraceae bacterium]
MPDYQKLYSKAFNAITDAENLITQASVILKITQQECEQLFMESDDSPEEE